jgi:hypothetical protein
MKQLYPNASTRAPPASNAWVPNHSLEKGLSFKNEKAMLIDLNAAKFTLPGRPANDLYQPARKKRVHPRFG